MKQNLTNPRKTALAAGIAVALFAGTTMMSTDSMFYLSNDVHAAQGSGQGQQGSGQGQKGKHSGARGMRGGNKNIGSLLAEDDDDDSDRPPWAGVPGNEGKPGGGSGGSDTRKGADYGDIWVILRDDAGVPILDENDNVQPCLDPACTEVAKLTADGELPPEYADQVIEVEFGRLNIARSPDKVLIHALEEALSKLDDGEYGTTITLDPAGRLVVDGATIDSPLENLALYASLITTPAVGGVVTLSITVDVEGGGTVTYDFSIPESDRLDLAASAFAAASDKTGFLTVDEIMGISGFMEIDDALSSIVPDFTYDRTATYEDVQVWIMFEVSPGVVVPKLVDVLDEVEFNDVPAIGGDGGIDAFTQAADDALQVLEYVHDNAIDQ